MTQPKSQLKLRPTNTVLHDPLKALVVSPMFQALRPSLKQATGNFDGALQRLSQLLWARPFTAGEILIETGEFQTHVLLFVEGQAVASKALQTEGSNSNVATLRPSQRVLVCDAGTTFGEAALLDAVASDLTLMAETDGFCWCLDAADFEQFALEFPTAAYQFQTALARRLYHQLKKAQETLRLYQSLLNEKPA